MNKNRVLVGFLVASSIAIALLLIYLAVPSETKLYSTEKLSELGNIGLTFFINVFLFLGLLAFAPLWGMFIYVLIHELDRIVAKDINFTTLDESLIVVGFGLVAVIIQVIISKPILETPDTWTGALGDLLGIHGKNPFLWAFIGFILYLIGYFLVGRIADYILNAIFPRNLNTASG